jgi:hypothetical protein
VTAVAGALALLAFALSAWLVAHRRAHVASPSSIEAAPSPASDESLEDIGVIEAPRLIPTAQREVARPKHLPGKRQPAHPARSP